MSALTISEQHDICACGDYRKQHTDGDRFEYGRDGLAPGLCWCGCRQFRLHQIATLTFAAVRR